MDQSMMERMILAQVSMACEYLSDVELAALTLAVESEAKNIKRISGYDKVVSLFTEADGTQMHQEIKTAFLSYAYSRLV